MSFFNELKRRNVFKVAAAYIIVGWLIMQVGDTLGPALLLPGWINSALAFFLILGFPLAMFFAWAFEMTPDGIKKEKEVDRSQSIAHVTSQKLNNIIIGLLVLALGYFAFDKFVLDPKRDEELVNATQAAAEEVVAKAGSAQDALVTTPSDKSIAVIPFQNRSANEENAAFFSDGVHDELLTNLSKISALKVISRTSVMSYRDTTKNLRQIGAELGVTNILEGGVQRAGNTVRINVQLINAATDEHLWAEIYDRELTAENIFAIQSEIAEAIAMSLKATLSPNERERLEAIPTENIEAYDHWLVAGQLIARGGWHDLREAQSHLNKALELDPKFVNAHVSLAISYGSLLETGALTLQEVKAPWGDAVQSALMLDDNHAGAHAVQAHFLWRTGAEAADEAFIKARQLEPANVQIMEIYGTYLRKTYQFDQALQVYELARELDPVSTGILHGLARVHEARGEPDQALAFYARIRQLDPSNPSGIGPVSGVYMDMGNLAQGLRWLFKAMAVDPEDSDISNWVARLYADLGDYERAQEWLSWIEQNQNLNPMTLTGNATLSIFNGNIDAGIGIARQPLERGMLGRWGSDAIAVRALIIGAIAQSRAHGTLELIRQVYPELFEATPQINAGNILQAIDAAHLLQINNQEETAEKLLQTAIAAYEVPHAISESWTITGKAQALALLGRKQAALIDLRQLVENGWRVLWRWDTEFNPNFESLQEEPEFQAIVEFLRADMARQLEEVRALEVNGEIPLPPGSAP